MSSKPRPRLCDDYRIGNCQKGESCKFAHVSCTNKKCQTGPQTGCLFGHPSIIEVTMEATRRPEVRAAVKMEATRRPEVRAADSITMPETRREIVDSVRTNSCRHGITCFDANCTKAHPVGRLPVCPDALRCTNAECDWLHPDGWEPPIVSAGPIGSSLKTQAQRDLERRQEPLPIFAKKDDIISRLRREKVLVVTAATGSGKTTQIPQYCAEAFGGKVACTQPRVMAAISIAKRIALEFDGSSVGQSVGYTVGGRGNHVEGRKVIMMTDSALVKMAQDDETLSSLSVLIIDEAHERNLNTDIVLGIARMILQKRPDDFYIVIASATIDPKPFLDFFGSRDKSLDVPGRTFPVTLEYRPSPEGRVDNLKRLISEHVIPTIVDAVIIYTEGHVLVFLPGQSEIEQALKAFAAVSEELPMFVALPLFGSLPPEEQDKIMQFDSQVQTGERMIVFCTNVAETSLTIPGVKLVIDLGLAKEARFDPVRRLQVIELTRISKSSADQRKGRAGRISAGHCIRLYDEKDLVRDNIEPEILRASLDTIVLQLARLRFDPRTFPFMTKPDDEALGSSLSLLTRIGCITDGGGRIAITARGRLFSELPFDPRLSAFVVACHEDFGKLELASIIAAILSAPGNIFFMGGVSKEAKEEAKRRVATRASQFDSDLLCMAAVFQGWSDAGAVDASNQCLQCRRKCPRNKGCRACRVKYSVEEGLNNKVLDYVMSSSQSVRDSVQTIARAGGGASAAARRALPAKGDSVDDTAAIGAALAQFFPEQHGEVLVPAHPQDGARLALVNVRARIGTSSTFLQKIRAKPFRAFVAMSVTQLPSGEYMTDRLHPVSSDLSGEASPAPACELVFQKSGVGNQIHKSFRTWVSEQFSREEWYWSVPVYDAPSQTLTVYNTRRFARVCAREAGAKLDELIRESLAQTAGEVIANGTMVATFGSGMALVAVEPVQATWRIAFDKLPIDSAKDFRVWLLTHLGAALTAADIQWLRAYAPKATGQSDGASEDFRGDGRNHPGAVSGGWTGVAVFTSEAAAQRVLHAARDFVRTRTHAAEAAGAGSAGSHSGEGLDAAQFAQLSKESAAARLEVTTAISDPDVLMQRLAQARAGVTNVQTLKQTRANYSIYIRNFPSSIRDQSWFSQLLQPQRGQPRDLTPIEVTFKPLKTVGSPTQEVFLNFDEIPKRDLAQQFLQQRFAARDLGTESHYTKKNGAPGSSTVFPEALVDPQRDTPAKSIYRLQFADLTQADSFYSQVAGRILVDSTATMTGSAFVTVKNADLYPQLDDMIQRIASTFAVKCKVTKKHPSKAAGGGGISAQDQDQESWGVEIKAGAPSDIAKAVASLQSLTDSISLEGSTDKQKSFFQEVSRSADVKRWLSELGLRVEWGDRGVGKLYGPRQSQGEFMKRIGDYFDDFETRYSVRKLHPAVNNLMAKGKAGEAQFRSLSSALKETSKHLVIQHRFFSSDILLLLPPKTTPAVKAEVTRSLDGFLRGLGGTGSSAQQRCVFCASESAAIAANFAVCGHPYCNSCILAAIASLGAGRGGGDDDDDDDDHGRANMSASAAGARALATATADSVTCGARGCGLRVHIRDLKAALTHDSFSQLCNAVLVKQVRANPEKFHVRMCPNQSEGCTAALPRASAGVQTCASCFSRVCTNCDLVCSEASHLHNGRTCREYQAAVAAKKRAEAEAAAAKKRAESAAAAAKAAQEKAAEQLSQEMRAVVESGKVFVRDAWPMDLAPVTRVDVNPGIGWNCLSSERFQAALSRGRNAVSNGFYAWHGTAEGAIGPICDTGFDPKRRSGQACGPGEYFGVTANVSLGYAKGCSRLILAYILRNSPLTTRSGFCYVVNNPTDWSYSFCLPLLVVSFGAEKSSPSFIIRAPPTTSAACGLAADFGARLHISAGGGVAPDLTYTAPYRWHWQQDGGKFQPYSDEINSMLEAGHDRWRHGGGCGADSVLRTPPIRRFVDDKLAEYEIDFVKNQQKNCRTGYLRAVQRSRSASVPTLAGQARWEFCDERRRWARYDSLVEGIIEQAYSQYTSGRSPSKMQLQVPGRPEQYVLDFALGTQTNEQSTTSRLIRRV